MVLQLRHDLLRFGEVLLSHLFAFSDHLLELTGREVLTAAKFGQHADVGADLLADVGLVEFHALMLSQFLLGKIQALLLNGLS